MIRNSVPVTLAVLLALVVSAATTNAAIVSLEANFDGLQMVPPNATPAFGLFSGTLDDSSGAFSVTTASYNDLLGGSLQIFLNTGTAGTNGPSIFSLTNDVPGATTGTFSGGGILSAGQISSMLAGNTYLRVSSQVFPGGEIRGQIGLVPEPSTLVLATMGLVGTAVLMIRRKRQRVS